MYNVINYLKLKSMTYCKIRDVYVVFFSCPYNNFNVRQLKFCKKSKFANVYASVQKINMGMG